MKIFNCEQRSKEWFKLRRGCFTASGFGAFLINSGKVAEGARQNFIDTKLGEAADGDDTPPPREDFWMKRGRVMEPQAIEAYTKKTGLAVESVGFVKHDNGILGCSPDGLIEGGGLETKCPSGKIQVKRLRESVLPAEYTYQVHGSMVICECDFWDFWSYHPALPPFYIRTYRDGLTRDVETGLMRLVDDYKNQHRILRQQWEESFRKEVA